jgi:hypothetical protein
MNEDERLSLTAFQVMERCVVDLKRFRDPAAGESRIRAQRWPAAGTLQN